MGEFVSALGNPWMPDEWNVTVQGQFYVRYGAARAEQFAELARKAQLLLPRDVSRTYILTRKIGGSTTTTTGGGIVGAGSSGDGPPA